MRYDERGERMCDVSMFMYVCFRRSSMEVDPKSEATVGASAASTSAQQKAVPSEASKPEAEKKPEIKVRIGNCRWKLERFIA